MIRIFTSAEGQYGTKVNFVDDNNVFVGYDMGQDCCEYADWFISDVATDKIHSELYQPSVLCGFVFDKSYFREIEHKKPESPNHYLKKGKMIVFRLVSSDGEMFLHLFNCHNGYYSHGFEMRHDQDALRTGGL